MNFPNLKLTKLGIAAILEVVYSEETITFTGVKFGTGSTTTDPEDMTDVVTPVLNVGFSHITVEAGKATLDFQFNNAQIQASFDMREIGIYAQVGEGAEFLYAYANAGSDAARVKKYDSGDIILMKFSETVAIGNAENVEAIISGAIGYCTQEDFENHIHDYNNPHRVTKQQVGLGNVPNLAPSDMTVNFTEPTNLTIPITGSKLSVLMGLLARGIRMLLAHLTDNSNPHSVSWQQTGAAAPDHKHNAADITSGTLPLARGGTGVTTKTNLKKLVKREIAYELGTLSASGWNNKTYTLGRSGYDVVVSLAPTATQNQLRQFEGACIVGSHNSNTITALGITPMVDIPVIITTMEVL